jgi:hypothetical protein
MRKATLLLLAVAGCAALRPPAEAPVAEQPLTQEWVRSARRIVVERGISALGQGRSERYVFERAGKCYGESHSFGGDWHSAPQVSDKKTYDLPPETFGEVRTLLLESKYLSLKPGQQGFIFEGSTSLEVECDGRKHAVWFGSDVPECRPLLAFLDGLAERRREVTSPEQPR